MRGQEPGDAQLGAQRGQGGHGGGWGVVVKQSFSLTLEVTHSHSLQASLGTYLRQCGEGPWATPSLGLSCHCAPGEIGGENF